MTSFEHHREQLLDIILTIMPSLSRLQKAQLRRALWDYEHEVDRLGEDQLPPEESEPKSDSSPSPQQ